MRWDILESSESKVGTLRSCSKQMEVKVFKVIYHARRRGGRKISGEEKGGQNKG